ncbi:foie gras liver health family 1 domain-containing protein [Ditylenchus destructor]|uniref:Foie gras liver health family 1 domain-containing protein n=1 Tax=Ditylenchus destructor TaxID=166010 RepID=A0AAD4NF50_9BILA|nr:foie gras liver health family 1 domain-containing protein [Ditylenchus destructor]
MDPVEIDEHLTNGHLKQLIMFTGLDLTNNPQHSAIYTGFANSRTDATPMVYRILTADHELITRKSSERQATLLKSVRGILKRSWPQKYLVERPALVVCFVDLDWDTSNWAEKKTECESKINSLRQSIGSREIRLCLVLVQKHATAHQNEKVASEKAAELCNQLRLQPKHLFTFQPCDSQSIGDCIARLERSFRDVVQEAYLVTLKKIRARSVPNNDLSLLVRQQFKQAFISELRQDTHSALRYYKSSYQHISELEFTDTDAYEILSVAGLLNYKVCELAFLHNSAFDAVAQFRRHQHIFFDKELGTYPSRELAAIEFALWKSQQCRLFADLFEKAVSKGGLAAYPFQNPGRFLEESAAHYKMANWQIRQLKVKIGASQQPTPNKTTSPDPLQAFDTNPNNTTYFGQRPWRHKLDTPGGLADQVMEHAAKVYLEQNVQENYQRSLQLLSMAVQQFKRYNCEAMQHMAMVNMADDYANIHQFPKALQLLHHVATELRLRNFRQLLYDVLAKYLNIAYCMVNLTEYVWALVQLLNPNTKKSSLAGIENPDESEVEKCCKSFLLHRFSIPPCPIAAGQSGIEVGISQVDVDLARTQWEQYYNHSLQVSFSVDMTRLESFVQCRARFLCTSDTTFAGDPLPIEVQLINLSNFSITFDKCLITIDEITIGVQAKTSSTLLEAHKTQFTLPATTGSKESRHLYAILYPKLDGPNQRNKQIVIRKVALRIVGHGVSGSETNKANASFDWEMDNSSSKFSKANHIGDLNLDQGRTAVRVISQRRSGIILSSPNIPMSDSTEIGLLLDEAVDIPFVLFNNEGAPIRNIRHY